MGVIAIETLDRRPIYEQLVECIRQNVLHGIMTPGEQLPSVRALAVELAINPNTIQKAYTELERLGIITSIPGRGSFIADNVKKLADHNREQLLGELKRTLAEVRDAGVPRGEAERLICLVWNATDSTGIGRANGTGSGRTDGTGIGRANGTGSGRADGTGIGRADGTGTVRTDGTGNAVGTGFDKTDISAKEREQ